MKKIYQNLDNVKNISTWRELQDWRKERKAKVKDLSFIVPLAESIDTRFLQENRHVPTLTWIGHSTFLVQVAGLNLLIDPVWANRLGFERRLSAAGISLQDMPPIDLVLISHNHYDHLHFGTIRKLSGDIQFLIPSGLGSTFKRHGYYRFEEFNWWQTKHIGEVKITFVPAQHWSKRTLWDTNTSHWGGWVIEAPTTIGETVTIYYVGDTGFFRGFREIGDRFSLDYVLMPIGAYEPEWFMAKQHVSPEQAVQGFLDSNGSFFVPMHYGAYRLADDTPKEALDRLYAEWERRELNRSQLLTLARGETLKI